jgi:hypothetical protein
MGFRSRSKCTKLYLGTSWLTWAVIALSQASDTLPQINAATIDLPPNIKNSICRAAQREELFRLLSEARPRDGETRTIGAGEIFLIENVDGKGHLSRANDKFYSISFRSLSDVGVRSRNVCFGLMNVPRRLGEPGQKCASIGSHEL